MQRCSGPQEVLKSAIKRELVSAVRNQKLDQKIYKCLEEMEIQHTAKQCRENKYSPRFSGNVKDN